MAPTWLAGDFYCQQGVSPRRGGRHLHISQPREFLAHSQVRPPNTHHPCDGVFCRRHLAQMQSLRPPQCSLRTVNLKLLRPHRPCSSTLTELDHEFMQYLQPPGGQRLTRTLLASWRPVSRQPHGGQHLAAPMERNISPASRWCRQHLSVISYMAGSTSWQAMKAVSPLPNQAITVYLVLSKRDLHCASRVYRMYGHHKEATLRL